MRVAADHRKRDLFRLRLRLRQGIHRHCEDVRDDL